MTRLLNWLTDLWDWQEFKAATKCRSEKHSKKGTAAFRKWQKVKRSYCLECGCSRLEHSHYLGHKDVRGRWCPCAKFVKISAQANSRCTCKELK